MDTKIARHELVCNGTHCRNRVIPIGAEYTSDGQAYYCAACSEAPVIEAGKTGALA